MFNRFRQRLQYKLALAFLLVLLIPAGITTIYNLHRSKDTLTEVVRLNQSQLIQATVTDVEKQLTEPEDDLITISQSSEIRTYINAITLGEPTNLSVIENYLLNFATRFGDTYYSICLLDNLGFETICVDRRGNDFVVRDVSDLQDRFEAEYFTKAISQTGHLPGRQTPVSISRLQLSSGQDTTYPVMYYSTLLQTNGGFIGGVLVLEASVQTVFDTILTHTSADNIYLIDQDGVYWMHPNNDKLYRPDVTIQTDRPHDANMFSSQASGIVFGSDDVPDHIIAFARIRPEGQVIRWTVIYEQPLDTVLGDVEETQNVILAITSVSIIFALIVAFLFTRSIVSPVTRLAAASAMFSENTEQEIAFDIKNKDEIGQLSKAYIGMTSQIRSLILNLEDRVGQRTRDLEISADVSRQISRSLDLSDLLTQIVERTRDGFDLYHVSIFLYDQEQQLLRYVRGSGAAGIKMVALQTQFSINSQGVVPQSIRERTPFVVNNTRKEEMFFPNPLLPYTKSEAAFPMISGDTIVGVLDLQATIFERFTPDDIRVMGTLAEQLAIAIRNAQLYEEVQNALDEAERANLVKSQFLANMSHELRTPLNAILNFSGFVAKGVMGPVNERQKETLDDVVNSGRHLLSLINDILDITKIEAGLMDIFVQEVDIQEIMQETEAMARGLVKDKPIVFIPKIEDNLPHTFGDKRRLRQVMLNIISNAIKYTEEGSITFCVESLAGVLHIEIADTGIGIASEDQARVFESFKQVQNELQTAMGTGLGMPISKYFVEIHGGKIWLESEVDVGTTFFVELPILTYEEAQAINGKIA